MTVQNPFQKGYNDQIDRLFGPPEEKIKMRMNKKLRDKQKKKRKAEQKAATTMMRTDKGTEVFDFIKDFSSSDYETAEED